MVRLIHAALLLLSVTTHVRTQFFDFFSALQPTGTHTIRPLFQQDITTKRLRTTKTTRRPETSTKRSPYSFYSDDYNSRTTKGVEITTRRSTPFSFYTEELEQDKQRPKNAPAVREYYTTTKPSRKTTKANPIRRNYDTNSDSLNGNVNRVNKVVSNNERNNPPVRDNKSKTIGNARDVNTATVYNNNKDILIFDDGQRNTIVNYETTRPGYNAKPQGNKKNTYTTYNPMKTIRPGVKPLIVNGPPITNRPPTQRPSFVPRPVIDDDVTPELIIGPNEDYMNTVDKKRYIEIAEKMCDKFKALDIEQIQAIPLLPSPDPYKVNVSKCSPNEVPLVVGGTVASIQEFRHMALLGWNKVQQGGYAWKCGGSLISNQYVLTAAHCAYQDRDNSVAVGPPQVVQLGSSYLDDPGAVVEKVSAVIRHPKYKLPKSYYDIALAKMTNTVTFSSRIKPACLGIPPPPGKPIIATGWGRTEFGGDQSKELRRVSLPIWDMSECYDVLGTSRRLPDGPSSDSQICAGEKRGGMDTCQGDSGGPAQIQEGCSWRVVAVTSVGRSCGAAQTPALYAKIPRAFVSAVVYAGQINNNQQSNYQGSNNNQGSNSQQSNTNQQSNNQGSSNQQWSNQQSNSQGSITQQTNKTPLWSTNQQTNQWSSQQQSNQRPLNQQWNNNQQSNKQQNYNINPEENAWTWNRNQQEQKKPEYNNNSQYNNQGSNNNVKRNDQNNNHNNNQNNGHIGYTTEKPVYNQYSGYNNAYTSEKPVYNQHSGYNNAYTTEKPVYNQHSGYNNAYTTEKPVYNQHSGYNNAYTTEKPVYNQYSVFNNGYNTEKPVYNQQAGYNSGYNAEQPVYNQQSSYNSGYNTEKPIYSPQSGYDRYIDKVVPGYQSDARPNNNDKVWWT